MVYGGKCITIGFCYALEAFIMYNFSTVIAIIILLFFFRLPTKKWKRQERQFLSWGKK